MTNPKPINLALQGGGAHGAFAWGVIDKFLEDGRLHFTGISATSAGAMNAVAYAYGYTLNGTDGARAKLEEFWRAVSETGRWFAPLFGLPMDAFTPMGAASDWASYVFMDTLTRSLSPYDYNPLNINPLKEVLCQVIDFDVLHECQQTKLFITATNVHSGKARVFQTHEITDDVVLASACLPYLFQAVEIDGCSYWDGGYMGNPSLWPLFYEVDVRDIVVVQLNPMLREETPVRPSEIMNRVNEISFNSSLLKEMRAIAFVHKLLDEGLLKDEYRDRYKDVLFHSIRADQHLQALSVASKFNTDWGFFEELRDRGREVAEMWLAEHFDQLGVCSTVDLRGEFLDL